MIKVEHLQVRAGEFRLEDISFEIPTGHYGVLMGKTGSGKTTILEAICGLKEVTAGRIILGDEDMTDARSGDRNIGFVPQEATLFSTMTVRNHLAFGPKVRRWEKETEWQDGAPEVENEGSKGISTKKTSATTTSS